MTKRTLAGPLADKLVANKTIKPTSRDWLVAALDPFHDTAIRPVGYPDLAGDPTIVECLKYSTTIATPSGLSGANWDCNIVSLPELMVSNSGANSSRLDTGYLDQYGTFVGVSNITAGQLTAIAVAAGGDTFPSSSGTMGANITTTKCDGQLSGVLYGNTRIIAMGFEVTNTTADIYKQGSVVCYRAPAYTSPNYDAFFPALTVSGGATVAAASGAGYVSQPYPRTTSEALAQYGAVQWAASEGAYVVSTMSDVSNPLTPIANGRHQFGALTGQQIGALKTTVGGTSIQTAIKPTPFDYCGAFFSGLSAQTTLQVTVRYYVEVAPSSNQATLVQLATPSASFDSKALELYAAVIARLPVACPVGSNASGDWWQTALEAIRDYAGKVGGLVGPIGGLIGEGVGALAGLSIKKINQVEDAMAMVKAAKAKEQKEKDKQIQKPVPPPRTKLPPK